MVDARDALNKQNPNSVRETLKYLTYSTNHAHYTYNTFQVAETLKYLTTLF